MGMCACTGACFRGGGCGMFGYHRFQPAPAPTWPWPDPNNAEILALRQRIEELEAKLNVKED